MHPINNILNCGKQYSNIPPSFLSTEEVEFMQKQATSDTLEVSAACCAKLNLGAEYFYAVQHQLVSTQQAWAAIIAEKERYDMVGWQNGNAEFIRALHTCLFMIPRRLNMGYLGAASQGLPQTEHPGDNLADLSSHSGSIPVIYDNGDNLPDYEDSLRESSDFEDWNGLDALSPGATHNQASKEFGDTEEDGARRDEGVQQEVYESTQAPLEDLQVFDPWDTFLVDELFPNSTTIPRKRLAEDAESDFEVDVKGKRKRTK